MMYLEEINGDKKMKKLVMIPLEFLLVIALFSLPVFILGRSTYLELRHFLHQDIIEFILSGKLKNEKKQNHHKIERKE